jgi:hypothetical protein
MKEIEERQETSALLEFSSLPAVRTPTSNALARPAVIADTLPRLPLDLDLPSLTPRHRELAPWLARMFDAVAPHVSSDAQQRTIPEIVLDLPPDPETVTVDTRRLGDRQSVTITLPFGSPRFVPAVALAAMTGHPSHTVFRCGEDGTLTPLHNDTPIDLTDKTTRYMIGKILTVYS